MLTNICKLAWDFYKQEYKQTHHRLMRWVQSVLLIFIVTLSLSSESIQGYLKNNLQGLLGADAVISQKQALTTEQMNTLSNLTSEVVITQQVKTILTSNNEWQKAQLKSISDSYPLQGELLTSVLPHEEGEITKEAPKFGEIWLDPRLLASLKLQIGDSISIANSHFKVSRVLQHEPDRLMEGHNVEMRAMINTEDMKTLNFSSDLVQYRYLLETNKSQIDPLIAWQKKTIPAAVLYHKQGNHPLALFWKRTENFMGLVSIILFFMAAIAIEQLSQVHMKKDQFFSAVCMSFGASKKTGLQISIIKWLIGMILLLPLVLLLSALFHYVLIQFLNETFPDLLWKWQMVTVVKPIVALLFVFAIFHAPVWLSVMKTSIAKQFSGNNIGINHWVSKLSALSIILFIAFLYSDNALLTTMMVTAILLTIALMIFISWSSLTIGEKLTQKVSGLVPFALFMMKQRLMSKSTQILGVGLCTFLLLFTLMLLKDIGSTMTSYQRQYDGNLFISQASQSEMTYIENWSKKAENKQAINIKQIKPYIHAKLLKINGMTLSDFSEKPSDSLATFSHSIRMHWSDSVPSNNRLINGEWWQVSEVDWQQISIEQEVMTDLGLQMGDWLTFFINQKNYKFQIKASHAFRPGAGSITFWVQMPPSALSHIQAPQYSMASLEVDEEHWSLLSPLWQKFPTLRMVSLKEITKRFDSMLSMITQIISGFSFMIILLSGVVILSSISSLESKEKQKNSIILSFGFSRATCFRLNFIEWFVTAMITAVGAIGGTYIAGQLIYQSQFSLTYQPDVTWLTLTLIFILMTITSIGIYASRNSLKSSVRSLLAST